MMEDKGEFVKNPGHLLYQMLVFGIVLNEQKIPWAPGLSTRD
jgi:hypothetical protein